MAENMNKKLTPENKLLIAVYSVQELIYKIDEIEKDNATPPNEKLLQLKKIRDEIAKLSGEIDNIKKEINFNRTIN